MSIFDVALESFIDMNHELVLLSRQIDWEEVESEFSEYYCADNGRPSVPIRTMVGMLLLKSIYNLSVKSKFSTNNFKKIRIPQFSETKFGSFVGLFSCFYVYKQ